MAVPSPLAIERAGLGGWPGIEVEWDGAWVRRAANGYTKRANSVQCFDPSDEDDVERRMAEASAWFARRGLQPAFRVNLLTGPKLAAALDAQAWPVDSPSHCMAMEIGEAEPDDRAEILEIRDPAFLEAQRRLKDLDAPTLAGLEAVIGALTVPAIGLMIRDSDGRPLSSALMAIADGIVITGNVVTDPARRRQGLAEALHRSGLVWAKREGARFAALNVEAGNIAAISLYEGLGYRHQYDYHYRLAPAI